MKQKQSIRARAYRFARRNPGLTATAIAHLIGENVNTVSARLYELVEEKHLVKREEKGLTPGPSKNLSWRYYPYQPIYDILRY